jgi:hypothetical protein
VGAKGIVPSAVCPENVKLPLEDVISSGETLEKT